MGVVAEVLHGLEPRFYQVLVSLLLLLLSHVLVGVLVLALILMGEVGVDFHCVRTSINKNAAVLAGGVGLRLSCRSDDTYVGGAL